MSLKISHLTKQFGSHTAVDDLSFEVKKGTVFGLLGRNGAGKSTTIKQILGLVEPTSGQMEWEGEVLQPKKVSIGYLPEERGLFVKKSVYEQLVYFGQLEGMNKKEIEHAIDDWLNRMEVPEYKNKIVSALSKGNQQKIQLIATLLHDPQLIILDEPFTGLDPVNVQIFIDIIKDEAAKGKTIIFSSHQMMIVEALCDELVLLKQGVAEVSGTITGIKNAYGFKNLIMSASDELISGLKQLNLLFEVTKNTVKVQTEDSYTAMDILKKLGDIGIVPAEFNVAPPTMQDIFVERIG
ncbi:MAG: ATP-binding cassette domain-containing protein [Defluviitaleaceae bacterium]|nr:ATP-binding cassette domain-containing protein [Defluviitaleaceae bacterium]